MSNRKIMLLCLVTLLLMTDTGMKYCGSFFVGSS